MTKLLDFTKPITTRTGLKVRILCTNGNGANPVVFQLVDTNDIKMCNLSGLRYQTTVTEFDLINVPEKITRWVNIYSDRPGAVFFLRKDADVCAASARIACIKIEFTEGEGL